MPDYVQLDLTENEGVTLDLVDDEVTLNLDDVDITLDVIGEVGPRGPKGDTGADSIVPGPPGPIGPEGPPGSSSGFYRHNQASAASTWMFTHDLQYPPSVTVVDSAGTVLYGDVTYLDDFNIQIDFAYPTAGYAYCT